MTDGHPDLRLLVPPNSENRWTDLLATLISTDPRPIAGFVGGVPDTVRREVVVGGSDRLDLLLLRGPEPLAAIEVKLLSDLGSRQLARYREAFADADSHHVLHLGVLPVNHHSAPGWNSLTWEKVLSAYAQSDPMGGNDRPGLAGSVAGLVPQIDALTVWNEVAEDAASFELGLRAKVAWLAGRMDEWCDLDHYLSMSSGGGAWAATMRTTTTHLDTGRWLNSRKGSPRATGASIRLVRTATRQRPGCPDWPQSGSRRDVSRVRLAVAVACIPEPDHQ